MITAEGIELRAGSRILLESATFRVAAGDRVGLVGRNGAGKTTLTKVLAGEVSAEKSEDEHEDETADAADDRAPAHATASATEAT